MEIADTIYGLEEDIRSLSPPLAQKEA